MRLRWIWLGLALLASPAWAEEPYYFHKVGVTREVYAADVEYCASLTGGAKVPGHTFYTYGPNTTATAVGAAVGVLFAGLLQRAELRRKVSRIERTCMADKGYQRLALGKEIDRELDKLEAAARLERLFTLVAAENPSGKVLVE